MIFDLIPDLKLLGIPYLKKDRIMRKMRTHATTISNNNRKYLFVFVKIPT